MSHYTINLGKEKKGWLSEICLLGGSYSFFRGHHHSHIPTTIPNFFSENNNIRQNWVILSVSSSNPLHNFIRLRILWYIVIRPLPKKLYNVKKWSWYVSRRDWKNYWHQSRINTWMIYWTFYWEIQWKSKMMGWMNDLQFQTIITVPFSFSMLIWLLQI